jgi:Holliday junction resolvase
MMGEAQFRGLLVRHLREDGWFVQTIESSETGIGIPDVYMIRNGCALWMELKKMPHNWPTSYRVPFRPGQYGWLHTNRTHKGLSFVGIRAMNGYVFAHIDSVNSERLNIEKEGKYAVLFMATLNVKTLGAWLEAFA